MAMERWLARPLPAQSDPIPTNAGARLGQVRVRVWGEGWVGVGCAGSGLGMTSGLRWKESREGKTGGRDNPVVNLSFVGQVQTRRGAYVIIWQ